MPGQGPWAWARQFRLGLAPQPSAAPGITGPQVVNQWAGSFTQPAAFQATPPALQSVVLALTPANSVGGGTGVSTAGNWLFCLVGGSETYATSGFTVGDSDDIHSWWRPGTVSTGPALTRASIWYTPNTARQVGTVYVAPNGAFSALTVLVVEVAGLGPWDTVTGVYSTYQAAATSLNLTLGAPSGQAFLIGAVAGDSTTAGQAFTPAGWSALHTVTATNGTDHTTDSVLTSACLTTSGSVSVSGAANSASDLSGAVIGVLTAAPSPIPAGWNAAWPYTVFEAGLGGGFETPQDQLTWTWLPNRLWSWDETTGVPYMLGQLQSSQVSLQVDNRDGNFSPWNPGSPWYSLALNSNMSFQSGISPWVVIDNATIAQSSAFAHSSAAGGVATFSMKVTPDGVTTGPGASSEQVAVSPTAAYSASAWFLCPTGYATGAQVAISWFNASHGPISTSVSSVVALPASTATWTQVTLLNQTPPANTAFAEIVVGLTGTPSAATVFYVAEGALSLGASAVQTGLITTGTPIRVRFALGPPYNRWYVWSRNALQWPEQRNQALVNYSPAKASDIWSVASAACPSPYRGEVRQDGPYAVWAMDDQPVAGGVQPATLRNSAPGNTNVLNITQSAAGAGVLAPYDKDGFSAGSVLAPSTATYAVAAQQGWMYGDPQSSPAAYATGNPVTASPGAAAWQTTGAAGTLGSQGWFLSCNDSNFPVLAGGTTIECWFNYAFYGTGVSFLPVWTGSNTVGIPPGEQTVLQQPTMPMTILELATGSLPVAVLQLDQKGHLNLITYNGSTATSNSIYAKSDLRSNSWHHVAVELTTTTWTVYVDGGAAAAVSGTATGMTSAWTWLIGNGDMGTGGGSSVNLAPAIVQTQPGSVSSTGTTLTFTLNNPTTAGNCLIISVTFSAATTVSGITLGGSADHFAVAKAIINSGVATEIWADPNCAGGQTSITITLTASAGGIVAYAMEFSGIITSSPVDQTASNTGTSANPPWTSGTTGTLGSPNEIAVGAIGTGSGSLQGPGASWSNSALQAVTGARMMTGWAPAASTAGLAYSGYTDVSNTSITYEAAIATFKTAGLQHGGNISLAHLAVYPSLLPAWRVAAHYWAAFAAFGQIPAPQNVSAQFVSGNNVATSTAAGSDFTPDGSVNNGGYNGAAGILASALVAAATPSGTISGSSARAVATGFFPAAQNPTSTNASLWVQWTGLGPLFNVYTGASAGAEKESAVVSGAGDAFINGFAAGAIGGGADQTSGTSLVQAQQLTGISPLTIPLRYPTTAGNCLVVCIASTATSVTSITLGGSADHFAQAVGNNAGASTCCFIWADPNCAGGQTSVVVTTGVTANAVQVMEFSGIAASTPVDKTASQFATSAATTGAWTSTKTAALSAAGEVAFGVVFYSSVAGTVSVSSTDPVLFNVFPSMTVSNTIMVAGFAGVPGTTGLAFDGTASSGGQTYAAAIAVLKTAFTGGASPPASASATGDTAGQRIERCLGYGNVTYPGRCVDITPLLVQAALDIGGQQAGANIQRIVDSDNGLLFVDNAGNLCYRAKARLAADTPVWQIGMNTAAGQIPFLGDIGWDTDPQKVWDDIRVVPYSPDGASLPSLVPSNAAAVNAAQLQYGDRPYPVTSYLQSAAEQQAQANWLFTTYGAPARRIANLTVNVAGHPAAWVFLAGANVGDICQVYDAPIGQPATTGTYRITQIRRSLSRGANQAGVKGTISITADPVPASYWS